MSRPYYNSNRQGDSYNHSQTQHANPTSPGGYSSYSQHSFQQQGPQQQQQQQPQHHLAQDGYFQNHEYQQHQGQAYDYLPQQGQGHSEETYVDEHDIYASYESQQHQNQNQPQAYTPGADTDAKSYYSTNSSQAHLTSHAYPNKYEMSEVPPMPTLTQQYPPRGMGTAFGNGMYRGGGGGNMSPGGYNNARDRLMKRRSVRQVELQQGNLVFDVPVPSHIATPMGGEEMTTMRYTAATCDPDQFMSSKYTLRPYLYGRKTEVFVVMTMYNEDEELFVKTMNAVIKNIAHLCSRGRSQTWGPEGWKKIVVCIVSDGRQKVNKRTLQVLQLMGVYQEGIAKDTVSGKDVTAHIFEYTTQTMVSPTGEVSRAACPVQIVFCLKEQNKKKLNSHRWFFNAFGPLIQPNICVLLDVGTKPTSTSIYELWKCFDKLPHIGGACGEICVDTGRGCGLLLTSPLAASQNFEYKMSNILDKPLESVFGYISVLPGAFSAYRYKALLGRPLQSYFKGETMHGGGANGAGLFERNMYLAEDRILCFEIVTKKNEAWTLKYVKSAKASTDVPTTVPEFISQRRRWLNGSLFAALHATVYTHRIWTSGHGFLRKLVLQFEFIYNAIQLGFTWTSLANFYLAFFFLVNSATSNPKTDAFNFLANGAGKDIFEVILKLYIALIFVILVCSLGNRPQGSKWTYIMCILLFGVCQIITLWCAGFTVYLAVPHTLAGWENITHLLLHNRTLQEIAISLVATYGLYLFASLLHFEPWHMITSFVQYLFFLPSYVNILMMYAMCNLHDVTWGTKGDNGSSKDLGGAKTVKGADGKTMMEVELPSKKEDVDSLWMASQNALRHKPAEEKQHRDADTKQADHDRNSRTNVVLAWVGTNMFMILVFTSTAFINWVAKHVQTDASFNPYLTFLFVALAGLSLVRFVGTVLYLVFRLFGH